MKVKVPGSKMNTGSKLKFQVVRRSKTEYT